MVNLTSPTVKNDARESAKLSFSFFMSKQIPLALLMMLDNERSEGVSFVNYTAR